MANTREGMEREDAEYIDRLVSRMVSFTVGFMVGFIVAGAWIVEGMK